MGDLVEIVTPLHKRTARDYVARMVDDKVECMRIAKEYGYDYWDGDRRFGFGGYGYDGRWEVVARALIERYGLTADSAVLDVGCGKGFWLYELTKLLPGIRVVGIDSSEYALEHAKEEVREHLVRQRAEDPLPFADGEFDLVVSNTTLHNLILPDLAAALGEMQRVGRAGYLCVESFRNDAELFNLQCWALTCQSFYTPDEWVWLYEHFGYTGDYEFIYFE